MNKYFVFIVAVFTLSCQHPASHFYTYEHWRIPGDENKMPLRGAPKEVKESLFSLDSVVAGNGSFTNYDIWRFDDSGRIIYRRSFLADSTGSETIRSYTGNGLQSETRFTGGQNAGKLRTVVTTRMPDGSFKELVSGPISTSTQTVLLSFKDGGNTLESNFTSGVKGNKWQINQYRDGKIQRTIQLRGTDSIWLQYAYSKTDSPDSVLQFNNRALYSKIIYTNNEQGDPVASYTLVANGDTVSRAAMQYEYDAKGNWIKKQETLTISGYFPSMPGKKETRHALLVREIKY